MLDFRLDRHDKNQLELKLNYGLRPDSTKQAYTVQAFVFVPRVLAMTATSYPADRFYEDTATFIRMTTPKVPLEELSSKSAVRPWASNLMDQIDNFAAGNTGDLKAAEQSLKLLACVFKGAVRDSVFEHQSQISALEATVLETIAARNVLAARVTLLENSYATQSDVSALQSRCGDLETWADALDGVPWPW